MEQRQELELKQVIQETTEQEEILVQELLLKTEEIHQELLTKIEEETMDQNQIVVENILKTEVIHQENEEQ